MKILKNPLYFEWDNGNSNKNLIKHNVTNYECEEVFLDLNKLILKDLIHSQKENRYLIIGNTKKNRVLFIVFTIRNSFIRVISARDINKQEYKLYEKK